MAGRPRPDRTRRGAELRAEDPLPRANIAPYPELATRITDYPPRYHRASAGDRGSPAVQILCPMRRRSGTILAPSTPTPIVAAALALLLATPARALTGGGTVTITRDAFGVPHVVAETREAMAFGVGYALATYRKHPAPGQRPRRPRERCRRLRGDGCAPVALHRPARPLPALRVQADAHDARGVQPGGGVGGDPRLPGRALSAHLARRPAPALARVGRQRKATSARWRGPRPAAARVRGASTPRRWSTAPRRGR